MARPMLDSPYIFGFHDPGGESIMAQAGRRGWILFTEAVGSDPNDVSGRDYRPWSDQDFGIICRINNGYGDVGTIPTPDRYQAFAQRVANFVAATPGCRTWIIGNEMNHSQEWPVSGAVRTVSVAAASAAEAGLEDPFSHGSGSRFSALAPQASAAVFAAGARQPIYPADYIACFRLCRDAIRALPGHSDDLVVVGAVAPWNAELVYPTNPTGDWVRYFSDIITGLGPGGCDGMALHTYTHGSDPALITSTATMNPPFQNRYFNFLAYRNFMSAIPASMRELAVFITETDQDVPWLDQNNGWVQAAYAEINRWNQQPGAQQIRCLLLYRWQRYDQWYIEGKNGVIEDFRTALVNDFRWKEPPPKPASYKVGDVVATLTPVNFRAAPGGQIIGVLPVGTQATIRTTPYVMTGGLPYWGVRLLYNGQARTGWLAQYTLDGIALLARVPFGSLRPASYKQGDIVRTLDIVNFRSQPAGPVLGQLAQNSTLTITDPIFVMAGGVPYWSVRGLLNGVMTDGWVAQYTQTGIVLLEPYQAVSLADAPAAAAAIPSGAFTLGEDVRTTTTVRMRRTPGATNKPANDTIALAPAGTTLTVVGGPVRQESMDWWRLRGTLPDVGRVEGWMAQKLPGGETLLEKAALPSPPAIDLPAGGAFKPGDRFRTMTLVRLRNSPGFSGKGPEDIVADIAPNIEGDIVAGPAAGDGLRWWQVQIIGRDATRYAGWMAEATADGERLMEKVGSTPIDTGFRTGDLVQTTDFVNVRRTPGVANKPADDVLGALRSRSTLTLLDGPRQADGMTWWRVGGILTPPGTEVRGWVAEAVPGAGALVSRASTLPGTSIPQPAASIYLNAPFPDRMRIGQLWGENSGFYANYRYDGVPLFGHNGVDFSTQVGTPILAVDDGVVRQVGYEEGGFGNYILLGHPWGESIYAHLSSADVAVEQSVARGQEIGRSGNTGASTGPHLHFAIRVNPYARGDGWGGFSDPLPYLPPGAYELPSYILDAAPSFVAAALAPAAAPSAAADGAPVRLPPSPMGNVPDAKRP